MLEITNKEYHSHKALGSTMLSTLLKNAREFDLIKKGELKIEGKQLDIGTALHKLVLEPETFEDEIIVSDLSITQGIKDLIDSKDVFTLYPAEVITPGGLLSTSKKAKEILETLDKDKIYLTPNDYDSARFYQDNKDKTIITSDDMELVETLKDKIMKLKNFKVWLDNGVKEKSFFGIVDDVELKCRPDLLVKTDKGYIVIDVKTMGKSATSDSFAKSSADFLYPLQEALYREVLKQNDINVIDFIFAGTSKQEWSGAGYYRHTQEWVEWGQELMHKAIFKYKWCSNNDLWFEDDFDFTDGGFKIVNDVVLPNYAQYKFL